MGRFLDALGGTLIVAVPILYAFSRRWLTGGTTKLSVALGACVVAGAPVILVGGAIWFGLLYR